MAVRNLTLVARTATGLRRAYVQWIMPDRSIVDTPCTIRQYETQNFTPVRPDPAAVWFHAGITAQWDRGVEDSGLAGDAYEERGNVYICLSDDDRHDCEYREVRGRTSQKDIVRLGGYLSLTVDEYTGTFPAITIKDPPPGITCVAGELEIDDDVIASRERHDDSTREIGPSSVAQTDFASGTFTNTTTETLNTTATGTNRGVVACHASLDSVDSGNNDDVTYDGVSLTSRAFEGGTSRATAIWTLANPTTTSEAAVVWDFEGTNNFSRVWLYVETQSDVDQTTEVTGTDTHTSASTASASMTVTTATGERCLATYFVNNTDAITVGANETEEYNNSAQAKRFVVSSQAGADGGAMTATWASATILRAAAVSINQAAGVSNLDIDVSETVTVADVATVAELTTLYKIDAPETVTVSDVATVALLDTLYKVDEAETATVSDVATVVEINVGALTISPFESVTVSDVAQVARTPHVIDQFESVAVSDSAQVAVTPHVISAAETVTVADVATVVEVDVGALTVNPAETVTVSDVAQVARTPHLIAPFESVTVSDVSQVAVTPHVVSAAETVAVSDVATVAVVSVSGIDPAPFEVVSVSDVAQVAVTPLTINAFETVTVSESTAIGIERIISEAETVSVSDVATVELAADVNPSAVDTVTASDVATVSVGTVRFTLSESESVAVSDVASVVSTPLTINVSETVTATDVATVVETPLIVSVSELVTVVDSPEVSVASPSVARLATRTLFVSPSRRTRFVSPSRRTVAATSKRSNDPVAS